MFHKAVTSFFLTKGVEVTNEFLHATCKVVPIYEILSKNSALQVKIRRLTLSDANKITQGNAFIMELFKKFLGLKICSGGFPYHEIVENLVFNAVEIKIIRAFYINL